MNSAAVELINVSKEFGTNSHRSYAVRNASLQAKEGELILLLGPSGSGKTTLLTLIAGLLEPTVGRCRLFGDEIGRSTAERLRQMRAKRIGFVFQNFLLIDALTVRENIALVLQFAGKKRSDALHESGRLLDKLNVAQLAEKFPNKLSQGEKQRVAVARAIANDAQLILADEPTASLETTQGLEIIQLLHRLAKERNKCVIVASHDLRLVEFADRVVRLEDGVIMEEKAA